MDSIAPLVSVIMLTYNREKYIRDAIASVLNQTYSNLELIIVDDGSTDGTQKIIKTLTDPRLAYLSQPHTGYGSRLRNLAFSKCTGEYIALLDSDDVWLPEKLQLQVDTLNQKSIGFTFCDVIEFSDGGILKEGMYERGKTEYEEGNIFQRYVNSRLAIYPSTIVFRRSICESGAPWNEQFKWTDNELFHRMAYRHPAGMLKARLVKIRKHGSNLSELYPEEVIVDMLPMLQAFRAKNMISASTHRRMTAHYQYLAGVVSNRTGKRKEATRSFMKSIQANPLHLKAWYRWGTGIVSLSLHDFQKKRRMHRWFAMWINPGELCFDIGAHQGIYTEVFQGLGARVIAVEPVAENVERIRDKGLPAERLTVIRKVASNQSGVTMRVFVSNMTEISTVSDEFKEYYGSKYHRQWPEQENVETTTLDELITDYGRPGFIKIDVEGHEVNVLRGLSQLVPCLCFEFNHPFRQQAEKCVEHLVVLGFTKFNYSTFENFRWESGLWMNADRMIKTLRELPPEFKTGDIYAMPGS